MRQTLTTMTASAFAFFAATAFAHAQTLTPQERELIAAAKEEGAVTIINPQFSDRTEQRMAKAFVERYGLGPNFEFRNLRKGTGAVVAQVRQEIQAGKFTVDVVLNPAPGFFDAAADRDAFLELDSGYWKDHEELVEQAGQYSRYPYVVTPFAYTFQPVWNASCPGMENVDITSYADLVEPALKGKTIVSDVTKSFSYANTVVSLQENGALDPKEFWPKYKATEPLIEFRTEPKMQMLISCQAPVDMWNVAARVYQNVVKEPDLKEKIKLGYYKEGQVLLGDQVAVLEGAPHPNAGRLLVEFLLSKEGTDIYVEGEALYSFRKGYTPPAAAAPYLLDLSRHRVLGLDDWVAAQAEFEEVRREWQKVFQ